MTPDIPRELPEIVRRKIRSGRLPAALNVRVFIGHGSGFPCACCSRPIGRSQVEYELEFTPLDADRLCVLHVHCHRLWFQVLCNLESGREPVPVLAALPSAGATRQSRPI